MFCRRLPPPLRNIIFLATHSYWCTSFLIGDPILSVLRSIGLGFLRVETYVLTLSLLSSVLAFFTMLLYCLSSIVIVYGQMNEFLSTIATILILVCILQYHFQIRTTAQMLATSPLITVLRGVLRLYMRVRMNGWS